MSVSYSISLLDRKVLCEIYQDLRGTWGPRAPKDQSLDSRKGGGSNMFIIDSFFLISGIRKTLKLKKIYPPWNMSPS